MNAVAENLASIRERMVAACARAGRVPSTVRLLAVSKGQPASAVALAHAAGQRDFGENYAQELRDKSRELSSLEDIRWHFIGPLQTNKVKYVTPSAVMLHTLERADLAEALHARLSSEKRTLDVLLEVNVAGEASKHGLAPGDVPTFLSSLAAFPSLRARGLMCIPPPVEDPQQARDFFRTLAGLARGLQLPELSMGMSHDFEVAIEEGATVVRVGSAIFGERAPRRKG
jgi:pyridoxal phosphate enzyme (YggS family)